MLPHLFDDVNPPRDPRRGARRPRRRDRRRAARPARAGAPGLIASSVPRPPRRAAGCLPSCASPSSPTSTATVTPSRRCSATSTATACASCGAWATSSATAPTPTTAARSPARHATVCLAGNHDLAVTGTLPLDEFSHGAALAARWTQEVIADDHVEWLRSLRPVGARTRASASTTPARATRCGSTCSARCWPSCASTPRRSASASSATRTSRCRSSAPRARRRPATRAAAGDALDLATGEWLVNPGSVGQPRDGDPRAAWLLLDTGAWQAAVAADGVRHRGRRRPRSAPPGCRTPSPSASEYGQ